MEKSAQYAVAPVAVVPMRETDSEKSQMVSQLLFGEIVQLLEERGQWLFVRTLSDAYEGWVGRKMVTPIDAALVLKLGSEQRYVVTSPLAELCPLGNSAPLRLSMGSRLPAYAPDTSICTLNENEYILLSGKVDIPRFTDSSAISHSARQLLNVPYLWGGRHVFGLDCSGFTQLVYGVNGIKLPRDAKDQAFSGRIIDCDEPKEEGDLAFFCNATGQIAHVGILLSPTAIIHASGRVRIDPLDAVGIRDEESGQYTHPLDCIMRPFRLE